MTGYLKNSENEKTRKAAQSQLQKYEVDCQGEAEATIQFEESLQVMAVLRASIELMIPFDWGKTISVSTGYTAVCKVSDTLPALSTPRRIPPRLSALSSLRFTMPGSERSSPLSTEDQAVCDQDVYSLFGDSVDATPVAPQQPISSSNNRLPRITLIPIPESRQLPIGRQTRRSTVSFDERRRRATLLLTEREIPFGGGICRQLAAMYTDVGMTTVERVRWLCGWMVLIYALTCCAWFSWSAYTVPLVGILTGTLGLLACQRPHEQGYITYVLAFLALNYAQLVLLIWMVCMTLPKEITDKCISNCAAGQAKAVFNVLLVVATGIFHWRVATITRKYVREFRMIQQLTTRQSQGYLYASYSRAAVSTTMATEIQSRSSASEVSVSVAGDSSTVYVAPYRADYIQSGQMQ